MRRHLKSLSVLGLGLAIAVVGLVYDVMFAGIPYQDPTPEMKAEWQRHSDFAATLQAMGGVIFLVGVLAWPVIWRLARDSRE